METESKTATDAHFDKNARRTKKAESVSESEMAARSRKINEMRVEFTEKLKTVESDLIQKITDQFNRRKGQYFQQFESVFLEQLQDDIQKRSGTVYDHLRQVVEQEVKKDVETRQGELYERLLCDARIVVLQEQEEQGMSDQLRIAEMEHNFYEKYERVVQESKGKLLEYQEQLRLESERVITQQVKSSTLHLNRELKEANDGWLRKWAERESRWQLEWAAREELFHKREIDLAQEFESKMNTVLEGHQQNVRENGEKVIKSLEDSLAAATTRSEEVVMQSIDARKEEALRYSKALEEQLQQAKRQMARLEKIHARELRGVKEEKSRLEEEHRQLLEAAEDMHEKNALGLKAQLENQRVDFERRLKRHFDDLSSKFIAKTEALSVERVEAGLKTLDITAEIENAKQEYSSHALHAATEKAMKTFQDKFEEAKKRWLHAEERRVKQMRDEITQSFTLEIQRLEAELKLEKTNARENQKSWMFRFHELQQKHLKSLEQQSKASAKLVKTRLDEYERRHETLADGFKQELLRNNDVIAQLRSELDLKVSRMKCAARQWSVEHAQALEKRYNGRVSGVEKYYLRELEKLQEKFCLHLDQVVAHNVERSRLLVSERQARMLERGELMKQNSKTALDSCAAKENEERMTLAKQKLIQLWDSLEIDTDECTPFLTKLFAHAPFSPQILESIEHECNRLQDRVPIFRMETERSKMMQQLRCLHQFGDQPTELKKLGMSIPSGDTVQGFRDILMSKVTLLVQELDAALSMFEEKYGEEVTLEDGSLLRQVLNDTKVKLTESDLAVGAVAANPKLLLKFHS